VGLDIVAAASHVIDDSIGVDSHAGAAGISEHKCGTNSLAAQQPPATAADHGSQVVTRAVTAVQAVAHGLVHEPPRIQLVVLRPRIRKHALLWRKDLDGHVAHLAQRRALQGNVLVRPPEQLDNGTTLAAVELGTIGYGGAVGYFVRGLRFQ
jgi:hypothetical protein